eukprot:tig00000449_g948.t1
MPSEGQTDAQIAAWWERKYEEAVELWGECERRATALHEENKRLQEAVEKLQGDERASNRALKKKLDASEVLFQRLLENVEDERRQNQELRECAKASERRKREVEGAFQQILEEAEALRHSNNELAMSSAEVLKVNEVLHERVRLLEGHVQLLQEQLEQLRGENAELKTEARSSAAAAAAAAAAASASAYQCDCRYSVPAPAPPPPQPPVRYASDRIEEEINRRLGAILGSLERLHTSASAPASPAPHRARLSLSPARPLWSPQAAAARAVSAPPRRRHEELEEVAYPAEEGEGPEEAEDIDALAIAGDVRRALRQGTRDASQAAAPARRAPTRPPLDLPTPKPRGTSSQGAAAGAHRPPAPPPSRRRAPPPPPPPLRPAARSEGSSGVRAVGGRGGRGAPPEPPEPRHVGQQLARLRRGSFPFRFAPSFFVLPGLSGSIEREVHANMHLGSVGARARLGILLRLRLRPASGAPAPPAQPPAPPPPTGPGARAAWSEPSPTPAPSPTSPHLPRTPSSERRTPQGCRAARWGIGIDLQRCGVLRLRRASLAGARP